MVFLRVALAMGWGLFVWRMMLPPDSPQETSSRRLAVPGPFSPLAAVDSHEAGRHANEPHQIPAHGWWQVLKRVWNEVDRDNIGIIAAGCAFYTLLALFPALAAFVAIYGIVADPLTVEHQLDQVRFMLPDAAYQLIKEQLHKLVTADTTLLSTGAIVALLVALWSATSGVKTMFTALNVVYEEKEKRSFILYNLEAFAFTIGGIVMLSAALVAIVVLPAIFGLFGLREFTEWVLSILRWPLLMLLVAVGLSVLYRFGPSRKAARWSWVSWGSVIATVLWILASWAFSFYVSNFGSYDETYGSLGAVIVLLLWLWVSAYVVLVGAEINSELELQTLQDTTTGNDKPMGARGAYVADNVAV